MQTTGTKTKDGSLAFVEIDPAFTGFGLKIDDFILGKFDEKRLGEHPPEDEWGGWFPPPERLSEWELCELTDWVEIESQKHDLLPDPETYPLTDYFD